MKSLMVMVLTCFFHFTILAAENPCSADHEKFCAGKDGIHAMKCMKKHENELSTECRNFRDQRLQNAKEVRLACKADRKQFCADRKRKDVMQCMQDNFEKLSEVCRNEIAKFRK